MYSVSEAARQDEDDETSTRRKSTHTKSMWLVSYSVHKPVYTDVCTVYLKNLGKDMVIGPVPGQNQKKPCVRLLIPYSYTYQFLYSVRHFCCVFAGPRDEDGDATNINDRTTLTKGIQYSSHIHYSKSNFMYIDVLTVHQHCNKASRLDETRTEGKSAGTKGKLPELFT